MPSEPDICGFWPADSPVAWAGGDKCLLPLGGRTLLQCMIDAARPQVGALVLNTNSDPALFTAYRLPIEPDVIDGHAGPLAGVLTAGVGGGMRTGVFLVASFTAMRHSFRRTWYSGCGRPSRRRTPIWPARRQAGGTTLCSRFGRSV